MARTDQVEAGSQAYIVLHTQRDENGYIPSLITAHEEGHAPLTGRGEGATPWYWGKTFDEAQSLCDEMNKKVFGITPDQADQIQCTTF